jgi:hypothetical protein
VKHGRWPCAGAGRRCTRVARLLRPGSSLRCVMALAIVRRASDDGLRDENALTAWASIVVVETPYEGTSHEVVDASDGTKQRLRDPSHGGPGERLNRPRGRDRRPAGSRACRPSASRARETAFPRAGVSRRVAGLCARDVECAPLARHRRRGRA